MIGEAVVKVSGNRKSVQHLEGGIVKELWVRDGDTVAAGDTLIVLDDSAVRAEHDVLLQQYALLRATEARLDAELADKPQVNFPEDLVAAAAVDPHAAKAIAGQESEFASRRTAIDGQELVLRQRIAQLTKEITGHQAVAFSNSSAISDRKPVSLSIDSGVLSDSTIRSKYRDFVGAITVNAPICCRWNGS